MDLRRGVVRLVRLFFLVAAMRGFAIRKALLFINQHIPI
jgi:hypothetical protein